MECIFQVGDKVVCVSEVNPKMQVRPIVGAVYTIRGVYPANFAGRTTVWLEEIHLPADKYADGYQEPSFFHDRFRPVQTTKTDISIFTEIVRREFDVDKVVKKVSA